MTIGRAAIGLDGRALDDVEEDHSRHYERDDVSDAVAEEEKEKRGGRESESTAK